MMEGGEIREVGECEEGEKLEEEQEGWEEERTGRRREGQRRGRLAAGTGERRGAPKTVRVRRAGPGKPEQHCCFPCLETWNSLQSTVFSGGNKHAKPENNSLVLSFLVRSGHVFQGPC